MAQQQNKAKETVLSFINALNDENFDAARRYVHDDLSFVGVLGTRDGADAYFADMKKMKLKYDVKKIVADNEDVCLFYDIAMGGDVTVFASGWYQVENDKISSFKVIFDPRPLLEGSDQK